MRQGLIQAVYELSDGSGVVLTVGRYITPGHQDIDGAGIEPDYKQPPGLILTRLSARSFSALQFAPGI